MGVEKQRRKFEAKQVIQQEEPSYEQQCAVVNRFESTHCSQQTKQIFMRVSVFMGFQVLVDP